MQPRRIVTALILLIILMMTLFYWLQQKPQQGTAMQLTAVKVQPLQRDFAAQKLEAVGSVKAFESITLTANITEYVIQLHFDDGQQVKKGDLLVELETGEERALLAEAQARVKEAQLQYQRLLDLQKKHFSSKSELDAQEANLLSAQAKLNQVMAQIKDRNLYAPFDGVLGFRQVSEGTLVEPGDEIVTLDMLQPVKVDFSLPEANLADIQPKQPVYGRSAAWPKRVFKGQIATISPRINEDTRSVQVRAIFDNQDLALKPGMLLQISLRLPAYEFYTIPEEALLADGLQRHVFVVVKGESQVRKISVKLIKRRGNQVEVQADFPADSAVVWEGAFKLKPNQPVDVHYVAR